MRVTPEEFSNLVETRVEAQRVIASLLSRFSTETALVRIEEEARVAKQSTEEIVSRTASNLLTSFVTRKPGGFVD